MKKVISMLLLASLCAAPAMAQDYTSKPKQEAKAKITSDFIGKQKEAKDKNKKGEIKKQPNKVFGSFQGKEHLPKINQALDSVDFPGNAEISVLNFIQLPNPKDKGNKEQTFKGSTAQQEMTITAGDSVMKFLVITSYDVKVKPKTLAKANHRKEEKKAEKEQVLKSFDDQNKQLEQAQKAIAKKDPDKKAKQEKIKEQIKQNKSARQEAEQRLRDKQAAEDAEYFWEVTPQRKEKQSKIAAINYLESEALARAQKLVENYYAGLAGKDLCPTLFAENATVFNDVAGAGKISPKDILLEEVLAVENPQIKSVENKNGKYTVVAYRKIVTGEDTYNEGTVNFIIEPNVQSIEEFKIAESTPDNIKRHVISVY